MPASSDNVRITAIICTRNRAEQLRRTLESAAELEILPALSWELLVVDNGSTDHTPGVIREFADRLPLRRIIESKAGLSNARNRGVSEARGEYICWTDDDVLIDPQWLAAYARAFLRHPEGAYFGGPISLVFEDDSPKWLQENRAELGPILAERQFGEEPRPFDPRSDFIPYGANYAIRAAEQRAHRYDANLGVSPIQRRLGEETTLLGTLDHEGSRGWWVPDARVRHIIPPGRQTIEHFGDYQRAAGETAAYVAQHGPPNIVRRSLRFSTWQFRGAPIHLWCLMHTHRLVCGLLRRASGPSTWIHHYLRAAFFEGAIQYCRGR